MSKTIRLKRESTQTNTRNYEVNEYTKEATLE